MTTHASATPLDQPAAAEGWRHRLTHAIEHASHLLPAQGPITVFIHHNTLHAFEDRPFDEAVRVGGETFGCRPYLTEERYRTELDRGRITLDDLEAVLGDSLGDRAEDSLLGLATRGQLRLAMLEHPQWSGTDAELDYLLAETDALATCRWDVSPSAKSRLVAETRRWMMRDVRGRHGMDVPAWADGLLGRFRASELEGKNGRVWERIALESLWATCGDGVARVPAPEKAVASLVRHRDLILQAFDEDIDLPVNAFLGRLSAAFLDQGVSPWPLPDRDAGLFQAFLRLHSRPGGTVETWLAGLRGETTRLLRDDVAPLESVRESLTFLGVPEAEWDAYLSATLLSLRGWGGMIHHVETRGDRVAHGIPKGSLVEFVAVRLLLDRLAVVDAARRHLGRVALTDVRAAVRERLRPKSSDPSIGRRVAVFHLAQLFGWSPADLHGLTAGEWALLVGEVEAFSDVERRRLFHLAYERRFRIQCLDAISLHRPAAAMAETPDFQLVTCIDEREESFRRHLEEVAPRCETFGTPGFFGVVMYYRGVADAHHVPLCPIVVRPKHWVEEQAAPAAAGLHERRVKTRKTLGRASHRIHLGTRSFAGGAILSAGLGVLATIPLVGRVLFPRHAARVKRTLGQVVGAPAGSMLRLERRSIEPSPTADGVGYTVAEMTDMAEGLLRSIGATGGFSPLFLVLGHGSDSLNNPHKSAYDCGACGGSDGGANGRAAAQILNDHRVRAGLALRGIVIPAATAFVGGVHNTCNDTVSFPDADRLPTTHRDAFVSAVAAIEAALDRNGHERSRRFQSVPLDASPREARACVDARSEDLAQARPELGHATNAVCVVGRRARTRGLFLDRRAFLNSYDPTQDDAAGTILARILAAAVPVCGGINLEYFFSHVDNPGYGCGSKLPHNITSLLGVMDGAASDLRTGLPWQMVEIHEPVRLLFVVETTPEILLGIMDANATIGGMVRNGWVQMAVLDPHAGRIRVYRDGAFHPYEPVAESLPHAATSADWYRGWRDHLEFARIGPIAAD